MISFNIPKIELTRPLHAQELNLGLFLFSQRLKFYSCKAVSPKLEKKICKGQHTFYVALMSIQLCINWHKRDMCGRRIGWMCVWQVAAYYICRRVEERLMCLIVCSSYCRVAPDCYVYSMCHLSTGCMCVLRVGVGEG